MSVFSSTLCSPPSIICGQQTTVVLDLKQNKYVLVLQSLLDQRCPFIGLSEISLSFKTFKVNEKTKSAQLSLYV